MLCLRADQRPQAGGTPTLRSSLLSNVLNLTVPLPTSGIFSLDNEEAVVAAEEDGESGAKLRESEAAGLTGDTEENVEDAWYGARDDGVAAGELERGLGPGEPKDEGTEAAPLGGRGSIAALFGGSVGQTPEDEENLEQQARLIHS